MLKLALLPLVVISLTGCAAMRGVVDTKPRETRVERVCPSWKDESKAEKLKLADEVEAAPADAVWPEVIIRGQSVKDQLISGGCPPA